MRLHKLEEGIESGDLVWFHPAGDKMIPPTLGVFLGLKTFDKKYICAMVFIHDVGKTRPIQINLLTKVAKNESR